VKHVDGGILSFVEMSLKVSLGIDVSSWEPKRRKNILYKSSSVKPLQNRCLKIFGLHDLGTGSDGLKLLMRFSNSS
jgi:hypothetical protein